MPRCVRKAPLCDPVHPASRLALFKRHRPGTRLTVARVGQIERPFHIRRLLLFMPQPQAPRRSPG
jgi:hypothetical protein